MRKIFYLYSFSTSFRQDQLHSVQKKKKKRALKQKKLRDTWPCPQELTSAKFLIKSQRSPSNTEWQR